MWRLIILNFFKRWPWEKKVSSQSNFQCYFVAMTISFKMPLMCKRSLVRILLFSCGKHVKFPPKQRAFTSIAFFLNEENREKVFIVFVWKRTVTMSYCKIKCWPRIYMYIDRRTESLWKADNSVHFVESEGCRVPWAFKTRWNNLPLRNHNEWLILIRHWSERDQNVIQYTKKWLCYTAQPIISHIQQKRL